MSPQKPDGDQDGIDLRWLIPGAVVAVILAIFLLIKLSSAVNALP